MGCVKTLETLNWAPVSGQGGTTSLRYGFLYRITVNSPHFVDLPLALPLTLTVTQALTLSSTRPPFFINLDGIRIG